MQAGVNLFLDEKRLKNGLPDGKPETGLFVLTRQGS